MQRRKDNEESVLATYISQLCAGGKLCTESATRQQALLHALRVHEAQTASGNLAASGPSRAATTALSLTHLTPADAAPATAHMHDAHSHAAGVAHALALETVTTGAVMGARPRSEGASRTGVVPLHSGQGATAQHAPLRSGRRMSPALPQPSNSPPLTLDSVLSVNHVSMDLQQQLEGLFKVKCMGGSDVGSTGAAAVAARCAADHSDAALAPITPDGGYFGHHAAAAAGPGTQQPWARAVNSMQDLQALEQLQRGNFGAASAHAGRGGLLPGQVRRRCLQAPAACMEHA